MPLPGLAKKARSTIFYGPFCQAPLQPYGALLLAEFDTVVALVSPFEHDQNIEEVRVVYQLEDDLRQEIVLAGKPERPRYIPERERGESRASAATVSAYIDDLTAHGRYRLASADVLTYMGTRFAFALDDQIIERSGLPWVIVVGSEPVSSPRFLDLDG